MDIKVGTKGEARERVTEELSARAMGSGGLAVFATPAMVALMENAACAALHPLLEEGQTSVGTALNIEHTSATPIGMEVWAVAEVTAVDRRAVTFSVTAYDEKGAIGSGTHGRFIVDGEKFQAKADGKLG